MNDNGNDTDDGGLLHVERDDISIKVEDNHPVIQVGDAAIHLDTKFEGSPPENVERDWFGEGAYYYLDFDEEYFDGLLEITPEYREVSDD